MALKLMGKKCGMMQKFDESGNCVVCTVIEVEPNVVTQIKTKERDGYIAVQVGYKGYGKKEGKALEKKVGKPLFGSFAKNGVAPKRHLLETRVDDAGSYTVGQELNLELLADVNYVDLIAVSKGKGYQGVMKLHGFAGIGRSHGAGPVHRHAGSTGMRSTPGRCLPGGKRASRMGGERVTVQNLKVIAVDAAKNLLLVKGAVPGATGALVTIVPSRKKAAKAA